MLARPSDPAGSHSRRSHPADTQAVSIKPEPDADALLPAPSAEDMLDDDEDGTSGQGSNSAKAALNRQLKTTKRAAQNRAAQRAFRERKDRYVKELEARSSQLDEIIARDLAGKRLSMPRAGSAALLEQAEHKILCLQAELQSVKDENARLRWERSAPGSSTLRGSSSSQSGSQFRSGEVHPSNDPSLSISNGTWDRAPNPENRSSRRDTHPVLQPEVEHRRDDQQRPTLDSASSPKSSSLRSSLGNLLNQNSTASAPTSSTRRSQWARSQDPNRSPPPGNQAMSVGNSRQAEHDASDQRHSPWDVYRCKSTSGVAAPWIPPSTRETQHRTADTLQTRGRPSFPPQPYEDASFNRRPSMPSTASKPPTTHQASSSTSSTASGPHTSLAAEAPKLPSLSSDSYYVEHSARSSRPAARQEPAPQFSTSVARLSVQAGPSNSRGQETSSGLAGFSSTGAKSVRLPSLGEVTGAVMPLSTSPSPRTQWAMRWGTNAGSPRAKSTSPKESDSSTPGVSEAIHETAIPTDRRQSLPRQQPHRHSPPRASSLNHQYPHPPSSSSSSYDHGSNGESDDMGQQQRDRLVPLRRPSRVWEDVDESSKRHRAD